MDPRFARHAVVAAVLAGIGADVLFDRIGLGTNVPIATVAILALVTWLAPRHRPADPVDWWLPMVALLASLPLALRTDASIVPLDLGLVVLATAAWSIALGGVAVTRRSASGVAALGVQAGALSVIALGWLIRRAGSDGAFGRGSGQLARLGPVARGALVAVPVVAGFSLLLTSADAVFGRALDEAFRLPVDLGDVAGRGAFAALAAWIVAGPIALSAGMPGLLGANPGAPLASRVDGAGRTGVTETLVVLAAVDVLFAAFAVVQVVFLFGGADTLAAVGMTYSDYARQGYFQLVGVVALAGLLLLGAHQVVGRTRAFLLGALALLALTAVILASAALRLALYQGAYGWTELRFFVATSIAWLGLCILWTGLLLLSDQMRWLPHLLAGSAIAVTLVVSAVGPQAFVISENLARISNPALVAPGGDAGFDVDYALTLGDDAIPDLVAALDTLPPDARARTLERLRLRARGVVAEEAAEREQGLVAAFGWNLSRERARAALSALPAQ